MVPILLGAAGPGGSLILFILRSTAASPLTPVILVAAAGNLEATHATCFEPLQDLEHHPHGAPMSKVEGELGNSHGILTPCGAGNRIQARHFTCILK